MQLFSKNIDFLKRSKLYFAFSGILVALSIASLVFFGLNFGIDFTGGSLLELRYDEAIPSDDIITGVFKTHDINTFQKQLSENNSVIYRFRDVDEDTHQAISEGLLTDDYPGIELRFDSIGPVIGNELKEKSFEVLAMALIAIMLFVAWAFRKASSKISSWRFGIVTLITLFHDVLITVGIFALLSSFFLHAEIGAPFIAALLTILGYSVNDTIIVFDRIREHLMKSTGSKQKPLYEIVNRSLRETVTRSINTSITTLLVLFAIFFFGGATVQYFVLTLIIGFIVGTYSSIFLASPMLYKWMTRAHKD